MNQAIEIAILIGFFTAIAGIVCQWSSRKYIKTDFRLTVSEKFFLGRRAPEEHYTEEGLKLLKLADTLMSIGVGIVFIFGVALSFV